MQLQKKYYAKNAECVTLPAGYYAVQIIGESSNTNNQTGDFYVKFTLEVLEGRFTGSLINDSITLQSSNAWKQQKNEEKLSSYVKSVDLAEISDTQQLFNKKLIVKLSLNVDPAGEKTDTNYIESIFKYDPSILQITVKEQATQTQNKQVAPQQPQNNGFKPSAPMQTSSNVYTNSSLSSAFNNHNQQNAQSQYMNYAPQQAQPMQQQAQQLQTNDENLPF